MDSAHYDRLRECEIEAAWTQTREDIAAGRYRREGAEEHAARITLEMDPGEQEIVSSLHRECGLASS